MELQSPLKGANDALPITDTGLNVVYSPNETDVLADIIFVHGLQGHPRYTWTKQKLNKEVLSGSRHNMKLWERITGKASRNQAVVGKIHSDSNIDVFWPQDLLPEACPDCRILSFGYDSHVAKFFPGPTNQNSIQGHSRDLLYAIARSRVDSDRPILFVAHSLGGILVKEVIRRAAADEDLELTNILNATKVILFLGTPHRGSSMASMAETVRRIVAISGCDTNDKNIRALHFDSPELEVSREEFVRQWRQNKFIVKTFQESQGFKGVYGLTRKIVMDMSSSLDDPRERAEHINATHTEMCRFTGRDDPGFLQVGGELSKLVNDIRRTKGQETGSRNATSKEEVNLTTDEQECLRSLCVTEADTWEYRISQEVEINRLWLFDTSQYHTWENLSDLDFKYSLLWIKGKPGAGKSTLLRVVVSKLRSDMAATPGVKLAFAFNAHGTELEKSQLGLFRSLLFQLFQQSRHVFQQFMPRYRRKMDFYVNEWTWNEDELKMFFLSAITQNLFVPVFMVIDGIDECDKARELVEFLESLRAAAFRDKVCIRICYSSRYYPHIRVGDHIELRTDMQNNSNIENYIKRKLKPMIEQRYISQLQRSIAEKAQGVFLWVVLVVRMIIKAYDSGESMKKMQQLLEDVPDSLEELYRQTLEAIKLENPVETRLILCWILYASRPLTLLELRYALAFADDQHKSQAEAEKCLGFIESDTQMDLLHKARTGGLTESRIQKPVSTNYARQIFSGGDHGTVRFMHESVKSFFLQHGGLKVLDSHESAQNIDESQLANACINYLMTEELRAFTESHPEPDVLGLVKSVELLQELYEQRPFLHYTLNSIFKHVCMAVRKQQMELRSMLLLFQRLELVFPVWRYLFDLDSISRFHEVYGVQTSLIHLACENNLTEWIKHYTSRGGDVNVVGGRFGSPLQAATAMGHEELVDWLLDHGADVHNDTGRFGIALSAAAWSGKSRVVKALIQRGSDLNNMDGDFGTPLQTAACSPNGNAEIINMLLEAGADIHITAGKHGTALQAGAYAGNIGTVRALLERGANIDSVCGEHGTALGAASYQGHERVVQVLLERGADAAIDAGRCGNALWAAAYNHKESVIRQILRHLHPLWRHEKVESEVLSIMDKSARIKKYHTAVEDGNMEMVEELIKSGVDPNVKGGDFGSALHTAALYGHVNIVCLLLAQEGIRLDAGDSLGRTPLWHAASNGHTEITSLLLNTKMVSLKTKSNSGRNILWYAAKRGYTEIARIVVEAGCDPYEPDDDGFTPIMVAKEAGQDKVLSIIDIHTPSP